MDACRKDSNNEVNGGLTRTGNKMDERCGDKLGGHRKLSHSSARKCFVNLRAVFSDVRIKRAAKAN